ncbi:NADase-type glycan-binding domain-containing protein [Aureivirga sp. CE67]|uniref:NADase-type glycan-binding domain-containing protein n=1 Tax=Aureivirga sp. CE67 TaxID=1788983 RepID=UPI0018CAA9FD|nr:hypothetical protein [Aureivirga sp. CE67]
MKYIFTFFLLLFFSTNTFAQNNLKTFKPSKFFTPDLSSKTEKEIERQWELLKQKNLTDKENKELNKLLEKYGEVVTNVWEIEPSGCSWYCGGGNYKITASSELTSQNKNNYSAKSANDLSYKTAWVEGKKDSGIGEFLEYHFKNNSPRITTIIISNGYVKSDYAWKNNNRVKKLKLYINGEVFGILELEDSKANQYFEIGTFGHNKDGNDLVLKFEILGVYKGEKYDDTAITEIYFDGIDVH